jgi:hypothetical protein
LQGAALVLSFEALMAPGAYLALTYKNFCVADNFRRDVDLASAALVAAGYCICWQRPLLANTDSETTIVACRA